MSDKNNQDKPSFFDPDDEAKSWPPSDSYEADDKDSHSAASNESNSKKPNLFEPEPEIEIKAQPEPEPEAIVEEEPKIAEEQNEAASFDYLDSILNDAEEESNAEQEYKSEPEPTDDFLVPMSREEQAVEAEEEIIPESDPLYEEIHGNEVESEPEIVEDIKDIETETVEESIASPSFNSNNFNVDDLFDDRSNSSIDQSSIPNYQEGNTSSSSANPLSYQTGSAYIDPNEELKPFRTYSSYDYTNTETINDELGEEKPTIANILKKVNRNVLVLAIVVIAFTIYYLISTLSSRNYDKFAGKETRTRAPRKEKTIAPELRMGERIPVWGISSQKNISQARDNEITRMIFESAGRENPFAIPDSILADYRKAAEIAIVKQQQPNTYKRKAYRATLVGVLTSKDSVVALIDIQEASFDVVEGTGKTKILQLATKAMDKAKKNTQELVMGSYVGPWAVTKIDSAKNTYSEAKVTIEYGGQRKVLNMGKSEELGIFDDGGSIDNLENPVENVSLDDFDDE